MLAARPARWRSRRGSSMLHHPRPGAEAGRRRRFALSFLQVLAPGGVLLGFEADDRLLCACPGARPRFARLPPAPPKRSLDQAVGTAAAGSGRAGCVRPGAARPRRQPEFPGGTRRPCRAASPGLSEVIALAPVGGYPGHPGACVALTVRSASFRRLDGDNVGDRRQLRRGRRSPTDRQQAAHLRGGETQRQKSPLPRPAPARQAAYCQREQKIPRRILFIVLAADHSRQGGVVEAGSRPLIHACSFARARPFQRRRRWAGFRKCLSQL